MDNGNVNGSVNASEIATLSLLGRGFGGGYSGYGGMGGYGGGGGGYGGHYDVRSENIEHGIRGLNTQAANDKASENLLRSQMAASHRDAESFSQILTAQQAVAAETRNQISQIARDAADCCCETQKETIRTQNAIATSEASVLKGQCDLERALGDKIVQNDRDNERRFNDLNTSLKDSEIQSLNRQISENSQDAQTATLSGQNNAIISLLTQLVSNDKGHGRG